MGDAPHPQNFSPLTKSPWNWGVVMANFSSGLHFTPGGSHAPALLFDGMLHGTPSVFSAAAPRMILAGEASLEPPTISHCGGLSSFFSLQTYIQSRSCEVPLEFPQWNAKTRTKGPPLKHFLQKMSNPPPFQDKAWLSITQNHAV